jgi:hypothetical protein
MGPEVTTGATMMCSFGMAPSVLNVLPVSRVVAPAPAGNIMDSKPFVNNPPFGLCRSLANPAVAAATAAPPPGVLKPMPCTPVTPAPWVPGDPQCLIGGMPALDNVSKLMCCFGGVIQIVTPGQFTVQT